MQKEPTLYDNVDEVDLKDVLFTLIKRKKIVMFITGLSILMAILFIIISKPIYESKAILEVGQAINVIKKSQIDKNIIISDSIDLDNLYNLKIIIETGTGAQVRIPKGTKLIHVISRGNSKEDALQKTKNSVDFILDRHKEIAEIYKNSTVKVQMTKLIGKISVSDSPVHPKKTFIMILGFLIGIIFSVLVVLFLEFFKHLKANNK